MSRYTSRRSFLKGSLSVAAGSLLIAGTKSSGDFRGANDAVRVAIAGIHGRGSDHMSEYGKLKDVQIAWLVDVDSRLFPARVKTVQNKSGNVPQTTQDVRRALDDKNLDAISIATPNHWHSLITIWACQAGKDVYVEKPMSHNIREGRVAVETARKYNRIVQHGTQSRSSGGWEKVAATIASGQLGKLRVSRGLCYKPRGSIGFKPVEAPPPEVDFNMWLGPAPQQPFHQNLVHYNWHWFWDTGNGDIGNQGVHEMDLARWAIPNGIYPKSAISLGGRFGYEDQGQTPNTQIAILDYGETQLIFEVRGLKTDKYLGQGIGDIYHCEAGTVRGTTFYPKGSDKPAPLPAPRDFQPRHGGHFENFIAAVKSRKREDLHAEILEGHLSCIPIHLANASYRLGELVPFNPKTKAFGDNKDAYETLARMEEHLSDGNGLKLDDLKYRLGKHLTFDPKTEFTDDPKANEILRGTYRKGFELPDVVA
ncbi:MAG TPA: Gfo/Idh/MocA family oxidoreductase [Tepidisphaeraceae bacterium]|jgi:predicted dehydrogenase